MNKMKFLTNLSVLLIEDDESALRQMEMLLRRRCGKVYTASNGLVGLKVYRMMNPDVIVTDLKMPCMDGLELSRQIRETNKTIPIIITTAFEEKDIILRAIDVGINKYIIKPIDTEALLGALGEVAFQVLKMQDGIFTGEGFVTDRDEKMKKEADIRQIFAAMLKEETGKGPQVVRAFIQANQVKVTLESILTKMEQSLICNEKNYRMVNYEREIFYLDRQQRIEQALGEVFQIEVTMKSVNCDAKEDKDELQFELKIY